MHRIDGDSHVSNLFDEGDPGVPRNPTQITAKWLNAVQEELCNFLVDRGITLDDGNDEQLIEALHAAPPSGTGTRSCCLCISESDQFFSYAKCSIKRCIAGSISNFYL